MTEDEREIQHLRDVLRQSLRRAPERINGASIQAVRDYKEAYKRAVKAVDKTKATAHELRMLINQVT